MVIEELLSGIRDCPCGKDHVCPIDFVKIVNGALSEIGELCKSYAHILLVSDKNTYSVAGERVKEILADKVYKNLVLAEEGGLLIPNEEAIARIEAEITEKCDLVVGVGSGVINDLCKHTSFKRNIPYYIIATAPSMDGYASVGAALILGGMKITLNAKPPKAIIADSEVIKNAPMEMIRAGYGDIIGKFSCLGDWKLSALINGEYFCDKVYAITYSTAERVRDLADGIRTRNAEAVSALMEALVAVGIAMSYVGNSRPASGCEHHLSHFFEITGILNGEKYFPHGIDVVYSATECAKLREKMLSSTPKRRTFDKEKWISEIERIYSSSAEGIIALQEKLGWYDTDDSEKVHSLWDEAKKIMNEMPNAEDFLKMTEAVGLDFNEFEALYGKEKIRDAILYAKDLKDRYTVLWLNYLYFEE